MGVDYYKVLGVDRSAKDDDLNKAYRKLTMKINKAYEVLGDSQKRAIYDQYGEEGLEGQVPPPGAGGSTFFPGGGGEGPTTFHFNSRNADDIFAEFFGFSSPSGGDGGGSASSSGGGGGMRGGGVQSPKGMGGMSKEDIFSEFFFKDDGGSSGFAHQALQKAPAIENRLPCSLEELYKWTSKKMKISRKITDASGKTMVVEEILTIDIKPGWKKGTKITFPEKGNKQPNVIPSDIVFIIDEKPHNVFTRDGNDLVITQKISLAEAITGYTVNLTTLDGRNLSIPITNIIHPNYEEVVPNEGMPIPKDPSKKGSLRIKFNIKPPTRLTAEQKSEIKKLLAR